MSVETHARLSGNGPPTAPQYRISAPVPSGGPPRDTWPPNHDRPRNGDLPKRPTFFGMLGAMSENQSAKRQPHSAEFFNDMREFWWNQDFLHLMAQRLDFSSV